MGLKALPYFEHRKNRSLFSERGRNSLLYGIGWFHHVGVRRNQHLAACVVSVASHKDPPLLAVTLLLRHVYHHRRGTVKVLEEWSAGVPECWSIGLKRHYSSF